MPVLLIINSLGTDDKEEGWRGVCSMAALARGQAEPCVFSWAWPQKVYGASKELNFFFLTKCLQCGNMMLWVAAVCTLAERGGKVQG